MQYKTHTKEFICLLTGTDHSPLLRDVRPGTQAGIKLELWQNNDFFEGGGRADSS